MFSSKLFCTFMSPLLSLSCQTSPESPRRKLQTDGYSALRVQPIAKKYEIFLFFPLVHTKKCEV
jgi:hypothetical protein